MDGAVIPFLRQLPGLIGRGSTTSQCHGWSSGSPIIPRRVSFTGPRTRSPPWPLQGTAIVIEGLTNADR